MFFKNFESIKQIIIMATLFYFAIIVVLRSSGKRTISDLNAFDFVVTVTIGSIAATTILSENTTFADGLTALITLVVLQFIIAKLDFHFKFVSKILKSDPTLVYYNEQYLEMNMKKMRITKEDILQEIRNQSGTVIKNIDAVILESNGKLSVISNLEIENLKELEDYR